MKNYKILIKIWIILALLWIIWLIFVNSNNQFYSAFSMLFWAWIAISVNSFITKRKVLSWEIINDERINKVWAKAIWWSWYISLLLVLILFILASFDIVFSYFWVLWLISATMLLTYYITFFYYKNKKV